MANYEFDLEIAKEVWKVEAMDALNIPAEKQPMYAARIRKQYDVRKCNGKRPKPFVKPPKHRHKV